MSISVTGYTEAKIEGKWYCIDIFQYDMNGHIHHIPCIEGQSIVHTALQWDCDMDRIGVPSDLSPQVKAECTGRDGKLFGEDDPHSRYPGIRDMPEKVTRMIDAGLLQFSVRQWAEITGTDKKNAEYECRYMYEKGWMTQSRDDKCLIYTLRIRADEGGFEGGLISLPDLSDSPENIGEKGDERQAAEDSSLTRESLETKLLQLEKSRSPMVQSIVTTIHDLQRQGINAFTCNEWMGYSGLNAIKARDACDYMLQHKLVINISHTKKRALYAIIGSQEVQDYLTAVPAPTSVVESEPIPAELISRLHEMSSPEASEKERRISAILLHLYEKGIYYFDADDFEREFRLSRNVSANTLRSAINFGLLSREPERTSKGLSCYSFNRKPVQDVRSDDLTPGQRTVLTMLYNAFKNHHFSVQEGAKLCHLQDSGFVFHAHNFVERGILTAEKKMGRINAFAFAMAVFKIFCKRANCDMQMIPGA